jgi:hypothetical protein
MLFKIKNEPRRERKPLTAFVARMTLEASRAARGSG